MKAIIMYCTCI